MSRVPEAAIIRHVRRRRRQPTSATRAASPAAQTPATIAFKEATKNNPRIMAVVPESGNQSKGERDEDVHRVFTIFTACVSRAGKEPDAWSRQHPDLAARPFVCLKPMELVNPDLVMTVIADEGLPTMDGGNLPVQDARGFLVVLMATGPEQAEDDLQAVRDAIYDAYNPSYVEVFYAVDPSAGPYDPVSFVPMLELPEVLIQGAFPGLLESPEWRSWLSSMGGGQ